MALQQVTSCRDDRDEGGREQMERGKTQMR